MTAFNGVVKRYPVVCCKVKNIAGAPDSYGRGRGFHFELFLVETGDRAGKGAHRPFQQGKNAIAGRIGRTGKVVFVNSQFSVCANSDMRTIAHAQLSHSIHAGYDQVARFDFTAADYLALAGGIHHAHIARHKIELARSRPAICKRQQSQQNE